MAKPVKVNGKRYYIVDEEFSFTLGRLEYRQDPNNPASVIGPLLPDDEIPAGAAVAFIDAPPNLTRKERVERLKAANKRWRDLPIKDPEHQEHRCSKRCPVGSDHQDYCVKISYRVEALEPQLRHIARPARPVGGADRIAARKIATPSAPPPPKIDMAVGVNFDVVLEEGQQLIELNPPFREKLTADVATQFTLHDRPPTTTTVTQTEPVEADHPAEDVPEPPTMQDLIGDAWAKRDELYGQHRPVPPHWGRSTYVGFNCLPNKDFSHLPRFMPQYYRITKHHSYHHQLWKFLSKVWHALPFTGPRPPKYLGPLVEMELTRHLLLEMAFMPHTSKTLLMLKMKAKRYMAQFDISHIPSEEYYNLIINSCLAAYFTPGLGRGFEEFQQRLGDQQDIYEAALKDLMR